jgi:glyoxylase-like metal-dependent hydrolase (beta-lactamase superfamily II)
MSLIRLAAATAAVSLLAAPLALAQNPGPAEATAFKLGAFQLAALHDAQFVIPNNGKVLVTEADRAAASKLLAAAGAPTDTITLSVDGLLVKTPGHVVVLDTGLGPAVKGTLIESLAKAGVAPGDVTDVFITHAHGDHIGGLITAAKTSAFPKAAIRMSANEWAFLQSQAGAKDVAAAIAPQVKTFEPGKPVIPGITPVALYGHTPGHVGYRIESQGKTLLDIGDTVHSTIIGLAQPGWDDGFDTDKPLGVKVRTAEVARLAASKELVFAPHFPFPGVGRIVKAGEGYAWKPDVPGN